MNGLFSYDSKLMQVLGFIADLFLCNVLYMLCCIPIVTIGPAQAGLHNAMRTLGDTEDDRSAVKQFFKGLKLKIKRCIENLDLALYLLCLNC